MQTRFKLALIVSLFAVSTVVLAADPETAAKPLSLMTAKADIVKQLPAGSMGFIVVNNVKAITNNIDRFMAETDIAKMLPPDAQKGLLQMMKDGAKLGEGFNPEGGFAVLMLDPKKYDLDISKAIGDAKAKPEQFPVVAYVAGKTLKETFPNMKTEEAGKLTKVSLKELTVFVGEKDGYLVMGPMQKAVEDAMAADKKASSEIGKDHLAILDRGDMGIWINMKVAGPVALDVMDKIQKQMGEHGGPMSPMGTVMPLASVLPFYKEIIDQMGDVTLTLRFAENGVMMEELVTYKADSEIGKIMAALKGVATANLLDKLPNLNYVLAIGGVGTKSNDFTQKYLDTILKNPALKDVDADIKKKIKDLAKGFQDQCTGVQIVGGGATAGKGLMGLSMVIQCKDADATKALLADTAAFVQDIVTKKGGEDLGKLKITYAKGADKAEGVDIDTVTITHPEMADMPAEEKEKMTKVLGESDVRLYVAAVDKTTVVVTFGGSKEYLAEAVKTAKAGSGKIASSAEAQESLKYMPKDMVAVALFNGGNLYDLIMTAMKTMAPEEKAPPFTVTTKAPIAMGIGVIDTSEHVVIYVPNKLVKEAINMFKVMFHRSMPSGSSTVVPAPAPANP